jgi:hypothetical protein
MVVSCGKEDKWLLVAHTRGWQSWVAKEDGGGDTNFVCLVLLSFFLTLLLYWHRGEKKMRVTN